MKNKDYAPHYFSNKRADEKAKVSSSYSSKNYTNDARNNYNVKRGKTK